jgi:hypothetical protein
MSESSAGSICDTLKGSLNMCELSTKFMPHTCTLWLLVCVCLAKNTIVAITHLPISPDLVLYDFILLNNLKMSLKGRRINDITMTAQAKP